MARTTLAVLDVDGCKHQFNVKNTHPFNSSYRLCYLARNISLNGST